MSHRTPGPLRPQRKQPFFALLLICLSGLCLAEAAPGQNEPGAEDTTIYFVRHAEKSGKPASDPRLLPSGKARARDLAALLADVEIEGLWACDHRRTRATLKPLAKQHRLQVEDRLSDLEGRVASRTEPLIGGALADELRALLTEHRGETLVISSHSNVMPRMAASLVGQPLADLPEWQYDDLYVLTLDPEGQGRLDKRKYGVLSLPEE